MYVIKCYNDDEEFYKIGITSRTIEKRFNGNSSLPYRYKIIQSIEHKYDIIYDLETILHKYYREYKYTPKIYFKGSNECFKISK